MEVPNEENNNRLQREEDIQKNADVAGFSYFLIVAPAILYLRTDSHFIQFHARQATVLLLFAIFFILLPGKLSWLNFLILAFSATGIIQANNGKWWRVPLVAEIIESGISYESIKSLGKKWASILKRAFTSARSGAVRKGFALSSEQKRIFFLEKALLIETRLKKMPIASLASSHSKQFQNAVEYVQKKIPHNISVIHLDCAVDISWGENILLLGGISESGFQIYCTNHNDSKESGEVFGSFIGKTILWSDSDEKMETILNECYPREDV